MYCYRPQQPPGYAPGTSQGPRINRAPAICRAQAKNQRRAEQAKRRSEKTKRRLPLRLRGNPGGRALQRIEPSLDSTQNCPHTNRAVQQRLRDRLVQRRCQELIETLTRRHGLDWASTLLNGSFQVHEGVRRLVESFGLRVDLENSVIDAVWKEAHARPKRPSGNCFGYADDGRSTAESEDCTTVTPDCSSDGQTSDSQDGIYDQESTMNKASSKQKSDSSLVSQSRAAKAMPSWKARSLRVLGLDEANSQELSCLEAEEQALCKALLVALENAEHAFPTSAQSVDEQRQDLDEDSDDSDDELTGKMQSKTKEARLDREVSFSDESEVRFFNAEIGSSAPRQCERTLQTKSFDGTSAHKAHFRRDRDASDTSDSDSSDSEEEFEDVCDEIADLMGRQRHSCLWSASW